MTKPEKKTLLILTNTKGLNDILDDNKPDYINKETESDDLKTWVTEDTIKLIGEDGNDGIKDLFDGKAPDFIAYHNTGNLDFLSDEYLKGTMSRGFSHEKDYKSPPENFYNAILPKVYEEDNTAPTLADIAPYFPSTLESALRLLHDIYDGKPKSEFDNKANELLELEEMKNAKTAKTEYETLVTNGDDWTYEDSEEDRTKLAKLRDELLKVAV